MCAEQIVGIELVDRVADARPRAMPIAGRRCAAELELVQVGIDLGDAATGVLDLGRHARHPRDAQLEPPRELERAGVRAVHREQLLEIRLGAIRIARRDQLGELEQLDLGLLLATLRDEDVLEPLVRLDVLGIEREHAAQVIDGLLVQAVLHVDIGLGEDLRNLLGVTLAGGRRATRIRRRLHVGREVGVVVLGQREVDARQALLVDERHRAGHASTATRRPSAGRSVVMLNFASFVAARTAAGSGVDAA